MSSLAPEAYAVIEGRHSDPFRYLGPCPYRKSHPLASEDESGDALARCGTAAE
jgi:hypothetical protein